jgi:hypothetical protein
VTDLPAPKLTPAGVFERLLVFMDKPWKAAVVVVLLVIAGFGYMIYLERARIADAVLNSIGDLAKLNDTAFIADAPRLLRDTRGDLAILVDLDLNDNLMTDRVGIDADGNRWVPSVGPQQALMSNASMPLLVRFLANEVVCSDTAQAVNDDMQLLSHKGYPRACLVAVPPVLGVGVGGLVVAWRQPLLPAVETRAALVMKSAAMRYASW